LHYALALTGVVCLGACTAAPLPTSPSAAAAVDAQFYREFVQNAFESPRHLEPIRLLRTPLRIYLRTEDEAGQPIDAATQAITESILRDTTSIWSGGTFDVIDVERGTGTRENVPGWITVKWTAVPMSGQCGRSTVGVDGGYIEFDGSGACSCGLQTRVYPRLVRHELGHAMGYYHTDDPMDVMYGQSITPDMCDVMPSARERRHARFAHDLAR
jgi:hypothetical protein